MNGLPGSGWCVISQLADACPSVASVAMRIARQAMPAILESSLDVNGQGRYSILACRPSVVVRVPVGGRARPDHPARAPDQTPDGDGAGVRGSSEIRHSTNGGAASALSELAANICQYTDLTDPANSCVGCGWIGFLSYEAGLDLEQITWRDKPGPDVPLAVFALYDTAAVFDHATGQWRVEAVDRREALDDQSPPARERLESLAALLKAAERDPPEPPIPAPRSATRLRPNFTPKAHAERIGRIKEYIFAGEVYQVNLTTRFSAQSDAPAAELYAQLRRVSPAPFSALLDYGDFSIISASPELFLCTEGRRVTTRPIKGTRRRTGDPNEDRRLGHELATSEKDRAELTMIVDLLRNDLGRVCEYGSVRVIDPGAIEEHPTVFHRVATIEGQLRDSLGFRDLLEATFPGGSVTGAPKIRAMQIISELEPVRRGVYCGAIGRIGLDGAVCLNVAIRTIVKQGTTVHLHAGGGIVAESDPEQEYDEVLAKLAALSRAVGCDMAGLQAEVVRA